MIETAHAVLDNYMHWIWIYCYIESNVYTSYKEKILIVFQHPTGPAQQAA